MSNFIEALDKKYEKELQKIKKANKNFVCNIPLKVKVYGNTNSNYIIRKGKFTKFLYAKNGCRIYFSDVDILAMLLQITNKETMNKLVENLKKAYRDDVAKYDIYLGNKKYEAEGIEQIKDEQILYNPQDIDISFDELLILINLILAKDRASNFLWKGRPDFFKHTLSKYISLIMYYYYGDEIAKKYLSDIGYEVKKDIYFNYNTTEKRDEKRRIFTNFQMFENSGIL